MKKLLLTTTILLSLSFALPAQWTQIEGLDRVQYHVLKADGSNWYLANSGGLFRLSDTREEWVPYVHPDLQNVIDIAFGRDYIYALVDDDYQTPYRTSGLATGPGNNDR